MDCKGCRRWEGRREKTRPVCWCSNLEWRCVCVYTHWVRSYMCIVNRNHFPDGNGLGISQVRSSPNSPVLAPSPRRPHSMWVLLSPCSLEVCRTQRRGAFFFLPLPLYTAGWGRLQMCLLPWILLSGDKLGSLGRSCKSSWLSRY